jgi:hypothetical protein
MHGRSVCAVGGIVLIAAFSILPATVAAQETTTPPPATVPATATVPAPAAQPQAPPPLAGYKPITSRERLNWAVRSTVGPAGLASGFLSSGWFTYWNSPREWGRGLSGYGKRLADYRVTAGISNGIEAGLGALWGEDPRYPRSADRHARARVRSVFKDLFHAPYADGRRRFAYARLVAAVGNNAIDNLWLPPSGRDWKSTLRRVGYAYFAHFAVDVFEEFGPDVRKWLGRRLSPEKPATDAAPIPIQNSQETRDLSARRAIGVLDRSVTVW